MLLVSIRQKPRMLRNVPHGPRCPFPLTEKFLAPNANSGETENLPQEFLLAALEADPRTTVLI